MTDSGLAHACGLGKDLKAWATPTLRYEYIMQTMSSCLANQVRVGGLATWCVESVGTWVRCNA